MKVGIDAGGTLIKIVYQEKDKIHYKKYPVHELEQALSWVKLIGGDFNAALTGGKSHLIQRDFFPKGVVIPEFQATCEGARWLLLKEGKNIEAPFLLVNIGTGTSWHYVHGDKYERILGSGVGGGIFTGLGSILTAEEDYHQLTVLAHEGDKSKVDMLVKDIYETSETPIDGNLTAANFAKGTKLKHNEKDRMAALTNMIVETIVLMTLQAAAIHKTDKIVFIGSALIGNKALRTGLEFYMNMLGLKANFLDHGEYCGAVGAYFSV